MKAKSVLCWEVLPEDGVYTYSLTQHELYSEKVCSSPYDLRREHISLHLSLKDALRHFSLPDPDRPVLIRRVLCSGEIVKDLENAEILCSRRTPVWETLAFTRPKTSITSSWLTEVQKNQLSGIIKTHFLPKVQSVVGESEFENLQSFSELFKEGALRSTRFPEIVGPTKRLSISYAGKPRFTRSAYSF